MAKTKARKIGRGTTRRAVRRGRLARLNMDEMSRRTLKLSDKDWVLAWIKWYGENRSEYERLGRHLQKVLETAGGRLAPLAIVETRAKPVASYAEKLQRKLRKYRTTDGTGRLVHPITDLCGARVITHTLTQVKAVCEFIEDHFIYIVPLLFIGRDNLNAIFLETLAVKRLFHGVFSSQQSYGVQSFFANFLPCSIGNVENGETNLFLYVVSK